MKRLLDILFLALLLVGCKGNEAEEPDVPISSEPETAEEAPLTLAYSRSTTDTQSADEVAAALGNKFAVSAWKTNSQDQKEFVLSKDSYGNSPYLVTYSSSGGWDYASLTDQYLKYWDLSAKDYIFYAIANYPNPVAFSNGYAYIQNLSCIDTNAENIMESHYKRDGANLKDYDLLASATTVFYTPTPKDGKPAYADIVPLPFHHLLSKVQFKIYYKTLQSDVSIPIQKLSIKGNEGSGFYKTGTYTNCAFTNLTAKETTFIDKEPTDLYIKNSKTNATLLSEWNVLPQSCDFSVDVEIKTTTLGTLSRTINLADLTTSWDKGKVYTYYLIINYNEDIILVTEVEVDNWALGASKEETQTNW